MKTSGPDVESNNKLEIRGLLVSDVRSSSGSRIHGGVLDLEKEILGETYDNYGPDVFLRHASIRGYGGLVATLDGKVVGHLLYSSRRGEPGVRIDHIAVSPHRRRQGIGAALLKRLPDVITARFRNKKFLGVYIRESYLVPQLFFIHQKFVFVQPVKAFFECPPEDGYFFKQLLPSSALALAVSSVAKAA